MARITTTTTFTLSGGLTLRALATVVDQFQQAGVDLDATVSIRTVSPDRPGEMTQTTFRAERVDFPYGQEA